VTHVTRPSSVSTVRTWQHGSSSSMLSIERGPSAASRSRTRRPPRRSAGWSRTSAFEWARQMAGQDASPQTAGQNDDDVSAQQEVQSEGFSSIPDGHEQPQESISCRARRMAGARMAGKSGDVVSDRGTGCGEGWKDEPSRRGTDRLPGVRKTTCRPTCRARQGKSRPEAAP
jgi:hypothetical protein